MNRMTERRPARTIDAYSFSTRTALATALVVAGLIAASGTARAESNVQTGAGSLTATTHLDFQIVIPRVLFLQVGTGTLLANNAAIDRIVYDLSATPAIIGNGVQQTATSGGDVSPGVVSARVIGNSFAAAANLTATTGGALSDGAGDTISWSEIAITTAAGVPATGTNLAHPGTPNLADAGSTTVSLTPARRSSTRPRSGRSSTRTRTYRRRARMAPPASHRPTAA